MFVPVDGTSRFPGCIDANLENSRWRRGERKIRNLVNNLGQWGFPGSYPTRLQGLGWRSRRHPTPFSPATVGRQLPTHKASVNEEDGELGHESDEEDKEPMDSATGKTGVQGRRVGLAEESASSTPTEFVKFTAPRT